MLSVLFLFVPGILAQNPGINYAPDWQSWCGKHWQLGSPYTLRLQEALFPYPPVSSSPLLDFQAVTASSFYIQGDDQNDPPMILVDTNVTYDVGTQYSGSMSNNLTVTCSLASGMPLVNGSVQVNTLGNLLGPISLSSLTPQNGSYNFTCTGSTADGQQFSTSSSLLYFPTNPYGGNAVKVDRTTGSLMVRNASSNATQWSKIIPFGFYDSYNSTTANQNSTGNAAQDGINRLHQAKQLGLNMVHLVPPGGWDPYSFDDAAVTQFNQWWDTTEELGLYVQYDMRNSYTNLSSVQYQVEMVRNRSNILTWYTGDEPDGNEDALNATANAYNLLYQLDGYHPVALVLNCENYYFTDYGLNGADIIMVDPYPIALNGRWSKPYNTMCDENYGDSGCDNCNGTFFDISARVDSMRNRARIAGAYRTKPGWIVPQAFDDNQQEFWWRVPTGSEGEAVTPWLAINHGATGSVAWNFQYSTPELWGNSSVTQAQIVAQYRFLIDAADSRQTIFTNLSFPGINGFDLASWTITNSSGSSNGSSTTEVLVIAVNQNYGPIDDSTWDGVFTLANYSGTVKEVLFGNVTKLNDSTPLFQMPRTSVAGVILEM